MCGCGIHWHTIYWKSSTVIEKKADIAEIAYSEFASINNWCSWCPQVIASKILIYESRSHLNLYVLGNYARLTRALLRLFSFTYYRKIYYFLIINDVSSMVASNYRLIYDTYQITSSVFLGYTEYIDNNWLIMKRKSESSFIMLTWSYQYRAGGDDARNSNLTAILSIIFILL